MRDEDTLSLFLSLSLSPTYNESNRYIFSLTGRRASTLYIIGTYDYGATRFLRERGNYQFDEYSPFPVAMDVTEERRFETLTM